MLQLLHPDAPPEQITRQLEKTWKIYENIHPEDVIAVALPGKKEVVLAEITGPYGYRVGEKGEDIHFVPVKWHNKRISFSKLLKHKELTSPPAGMREIHEPATRIAVRDRLPHSYNRFAAFKWIIVIFIAWHMIERFRHMLSGPGY
jgi:hypothetical protein